jgi:hypothetical protein
LEEAPMDNILPINAAMFLPPPWKNGKSSKKIKQIYPHTNEGI